MSEPNNLFVFSTFTNTEGTKTTALVITQAHINSLPKMGKAMMNQGGLLALATGKWRGREKEVLYGQTGDYLVKSEDGSLHILTRDVFEKELKLKILKGDDTDGNLALNNGPSDERQRDNTSEPSVSEPSI